jgi:tetratricopeptide (TPR) repeat protein
VNGSALDRFDAALGIDANTAHAWMWSAATSMWSGDGRGAVEKITRGSALSPYDPLMYFSHSVAGMAYLADGQYERAIEYAYLSLRENKNYASGYRHLVIALMLAGRSDEARSAARRLLTIEPNVTVERFRLRFPGRDSPQAHLYCQALSEAGVPRG